MMSRKVALVAWAFMMAIGWTTMARADVLEPKHVAADAKWLLHIDADAARKSAVVLAFYNECLSQFPEVKEHFAISSARWGVDLPKDLHDITAYGTRLGPRHGVAVVRANIKQEEFLKELKEKVSPEVTEHAGFTIYTWSKRWHEHTHHMALAFFKPDVLVAGHSWKAVSSALDVLSGKAASLSTDSPLAGKTPEGTVFVLRAVGLNEVQGHHPILKQLERVDAVAAEHNGQWNRNLVVVATSPEAAGKIKDILQGWISFVSLFLHDQPGVDVLLSKAKLSVDGKVVHVAFSAPAHDVVAQIPVFCKFLKKHLEWHRKMSEKMCQGMMHHDMMNKMHEMHEKMHKMMKEKQ